MTLHATRDGQKITVNGNTGVEVLVQNSHLSHVKITEDARHVRYFHTQLGELLDAADQERTTAELTPETSNELAVGTELTLAGLLGVPPGGAAAEQLRRDFARIREAERAAAMAAAGIWLD
jgi:hypothetical protein